MFLLDSSLIGFITHASLRQYEPINVLIKSLAPLAITKNGEFYVNHVNIEFTFQFYQRPCNKSFAAAAAWSIASCAVISFAQSAPIAGSMASEKICPAFLSQYCTG
jgi:hypothetical protein